jgi:hypothetical protein
MRSAQILAEAADGAGTSSNARNEIFNITNGDTFHLAAYVAEDREDVRHGLYQYRADARFEQSSSTDQLLVARMLSRTLMIS